MDKESKRRLLMNVVYTLEEKRDQSIRKWIPKSLKN